MTCSTMKLLCVLVFFGITFTASAQEKSTLPAPSGDLPDTTYGRVKYYLAMKTPGGEEVSLEAFRGKVLFVNFWATWCVPCVREIPSIVRLKESLGDAPVEFLLISIDESPRDVRKYLRKHATSLPVYIRNWKPGESTFRGVAIPTTYLVSADGEMVYHHTGAADWSGREIRELVLSLVNQP